MRTAPDRALRVLALGNVYPPHMLGGYEVIWRGVTRELVREGHRARVLTTTYRRPDVPADAEEDPDVHRELEWYWRDHAWPSMTLRERLTLERHNARVLERHLQEFRPDVVTWWAVGGMSLGLVERVRRAGIPALLFVLDPWPSYGPRHDLWMRAWARLPRAGAALGERLTGLPTRFDLARAGRWLFCSGSMRAQTLETGLTLPDEAILSPGVEASYLEQPREQEPPAWRWRLLYVGRVVEQKGVRTAIEALAQLPEASLRIVGEGDRPYREELMRLAERLGVAARVHFEPPRPREELHGVYREADAVLFPVRWHEPWGLVPLEAMALGRPVVATGRGGSGDYLADGRNALVFPSARSEDLAAAVLRLAGDEALRERLRAGGYATAAEHTEAAFNRGAVAEIVAAAAR